MNPIIIDPDMKINMSLDEIIRLTRGTVNNKIQNNRTKKRKKKLLKSGDSNHSLPLFSSTEGVSIVVSKKSPLLKPDIKQSFLKAITNRALNAELIKKSARIIPAKYKLIKTDNGVEKILVPVKNYKFEHPRKLHQKRNFRDFNSTCDDIPPLISVPVSKPVYSPFNAIKEMLDSSTKMDVDVDDGDDDDDVVLLKCIKKEPEVIDVEMNMPVGVSQYEPSKSNSANTLNDRFTRLSGRLQF